MHGRRLETAAPAISRHSVLSIFVDLCFSTVQEFQFSKNIEDRDAQVIQLCANPFPQSGSYMSQSELLFISYVYVCIYMYILASPHATPYLMLRHDVMILSYTAIYK